MIIFLLKDYYILHMLYYCKFMSRLYNQPIRQYSATIETKKGSICSVHIYSFYSYLVDILFLVMYVYNNLILVQQMTVYCNIISIYGPFSAVCFTVMYMNYPSVFDIILSCRNNAILWDNTFHMHKLPKLYLS